MDIRQIKHAYTVAKTLSFSKAAKILYISQPALSQSVSKIEKELGIVLFERNTHSISLTKDGQLFLQQAEKVLKEYNELLDSLSHDGEYRNNFLDIGIVTSFSDYGLSAMLDEFEKRNKGLIIRKRWGGSNALLNLLIMNEISACIIMAKENTLKELKLNYHKLFDDELVLMISNKNKLTNQNKINIQDLIDEKIYIYSSASNAEYLAGTKQIVNDIFASFGMGNKKFHNYNVIDESVHRANSNEGIFFILKSSAHLASPFKGIKIKETEPILKASFYLVSKSDNKHYLINKLYNYAKEYKYITR